MHHTPRFRCMLRFASIVITALASCCLIGCAVVSSNDAAWQSIDLQGTGLDFEPREVGGYLPNPNHALDATPYRGRWLRFSAQVAHAQADVRLHLNVYRNQALVAQQAPALCEATTGPTRCTAYVWVPPDATHVSAPIWASASATRVSDARLHSAVQTQSTKSSDERLDAFLIELRRRYHHTQDANWAAIEAWVRPMMVAPMDMDPLPIAAQVVLRLLPHNKHSFLIRTRERTPPAIAQTTEVPTCEPVDENTRRLTVPGAAQLTPRERDVYVASAHACIHAAPPTTRWIVDLRSNDGGDMHIMVASLAPFLQHGRLMTFLKPQGVQETVSLTRGGVDVEGELTYAWTGDPASHAQTTIVVWLGPQCRSSCEATAIVLSRRPKTLLVGEATGGFATVNEDISINKDYTLFFTVGWMGDIDGRIVHDLVEPNVAILTDDPKQLIPLFVRLNP